MLERERIARAVAEQRTGDPERWRDFVHEVELALELAAGQPSTTARDFLDDANQQRAT